ncbi:TlpA family protein disulfide reductase [Niabella aurantiaca]|uniref:TlpA family protein disulfide reductase n=1 Tax=Niabella aurantiaca TaxID=379900 RepID=UPI0003621515|nr:TlpA disulfide reductase family protein [Niabella aurantiaca]
MKKFIFLCAALLIGYKGPAQEIRIPVALQNGYGPFYRTISTITTDSIPGNGSLLKGIPANLDSVQLRVITILPHQYQYQNLLSANAKDPRPDSLPAIWLARVEKEKLTGKEINCFFNVVSGIHKATGKSQVIIDKNRNDDFSDDTAFTPVSLKSLKDKRMMERATFPITFERYNGKRIITEKARLLVAMNSRKTIMVNFSQFGSAAWNGHHFYISPRYFMSLSYVNSDLIFGKGRLAADSVPSGQIIQQGRFLNIKGQSYQFLGVDILTQHIRLKKINGKDNLHSDQIGFRAPSLQGRRLLTSQLMNIAGLPGKYLFIDFWATWCKPCIAQLRSIQSYYQLADTSKIEFIGVGMDSRKEDLKAVISRFKLRYPQIVPDSGIEQTYSIPALPSNLLIGKNNLIIAKDISIDSLGSFIKKNGLLQ